MTEIGKLLTISPRDAWKHEAHDFTPWLSENLEQLGDAIGLQLEPDGTEVAVGPFSADILAKDMFGRMVLIENQLESTDHNHLGQILTYLSGLEAEIIIWIATDFREPHLSAINWLNENTNDKFSFFAIRLRVVRINHSIPAPVFDVLARPNQWERSMQKKCAKLLENLHPLRLRAESSGSIISNATQTMLNLVFKSRAAPLIGLQHQNTLECLYPSTKQKLVSVSFSVANAV